MARHPADGGEHDNVNANASGLLAEVESLRHRLAALEAHLPGNAAKEPPRRQAKRPISTKTIAWLTTGAVLAMLAGASVVYGQSAVDALFISKEGNVAIGPSGALFVGKEGRVGIGTATPAATLDVFGGLLHVAGNTTLTVTSQGAYLGWNALSGGTGETDFINNQGGGSGGFAFMNTPRSGDPRTTLMVISGAGNVGIGTATPKADNKLEVNGTIAANSLNIVGSTSMKTMSTLDQGVKIEGAGGRNMFSDEEKAGNLRVGAVWGTPGIYSEKGDVVLGSQSNNVWLYGKVAISTQGDAGKRNQPETLYVDGGIKATGTVDGNMKTRWQLNNDAERVFTKPNWRYDITLTAGDSGAKTRTIPRDVLIALCSERDGCNVVVGRRLWSANETTTWSNTFHFIYNKDTQGFRSDGPYNRDGSTVNGQAAVRAGDAPGGYCYLTNETVVNNQFMGNKGAGMQLLLDRGGRPERMCELTLIP